MTQNPKKYTVAQITFNTMKPTRLTFDDLYTWVIWQFPKHKEGGLCGAVHPPSSQHGWFPAIILVNEKCVEVHAHLMEQYETPESAADHFYKNGKSE